MKKILLTLSLISYITLNSQNIRVPDNNFKKALLNASSITQIAKDINGQWSAIDLNSDNEIQISEAENVAQLNLSWKNISSLVGIEYFKNLFFLNLNGNKLNSLDLSSNIKLEDVNCTYSQIKEINLSKNLLLKKLYCGGNDLTSIDLSLNTKLEELDCTYSKISELNFSRNLLLKKLSCGNNKLKSLDLINNKALIFLSCFQNELSNLNLTANKELVKLICYLTNLNSIDLSQNLKLTDLNFSSNNISNIDLTNNELLIDLSCEYTNLTTLDLSSNSNLTHVNCVGISTLSYINLKNGNNHNYIQGGDDFQGLPNLRSVCIDAVGSKMQNFISSFASHLINFSQDCSTLSLHEKKIINFKIFPIPVKDILNIYSNSQIVKITIFDELGKLIQNDINTNKVDISELSTGLYFLKLEDINGNLVITKVLKE